MEFFEALEKRHCCRSFNPSKEVTDDQIKEIIKAGKMAPSAGGIYPIEFSVISKKSLKEKLAKIANDQDFLIDAPVVIVIWADISKTEIKYGERGKNLYVIQDGAAAAENIFLATTALGLSACWIGGFDQEKVKEILNLSENQEPQVIIPIGYSA